jgi:hypothetical protein
MVVGAPRRISLRCGGKDLELTLSCVVYTHSIMNTWLQLNSAEFVRRCLKAWRGFRRTRTGDRNGLTGTEADGCGL